MAGYRDTTMSFGLQSCTKFILAVLFLFTKDISASKHVTEINHGMFEGFLQGKLFVITYVDSTGCSRCRNLYPFFAAASQAFSRDDDIYFTRTYDKHLIQEWGITELPALVYHRKDADSTNAFGARAVLSVDITVDDIIDGIERTLHGDFDSIKRRYSVRLNANNYDEMITTPTQSVLMLMYDKKSKKDTFSVIEKVAYAFRKDDAILFASLDVDKHGDLRDSRFKTRDAPAIMWLGEKEKKTVKRFGGMITKELVVTFINERTGLHRMSTGALFREAGRIPQVDELLEEHADIVYNADPDTLALLSQAIKEKKPDMHNHQEEMLDYYVFVVEEMAKVGESSDVLENLVLNLHARLYEVDEEMSTKTTEFLKRQKNVLHHFQYVIKLFRTGEWQTATALRHDRLDSKVTVDAKHHHVHTEL